MVAAVYTRIAVCMGDLVLKCARLLWCTEALRCVNRWRCVARANWALPCTQAIDALVARTHPGGRTPRPPF
eukprot:8596822-Pyramimonas_sp.AAC.1